MSMKNPLTPAGIETANFRTVAQHLKKTPYAEEIIGDHNCAFVT